MTTTKTAKDPSGKEQAAKAKAITPAELGALYDAAYANGTNSHIEALRAVYEAGARSGLARG